jgi:hypothetical protein
MLYGRSPLHGAASILKGAGAQPAFSSPMEATDRAVTFASQRSLASAVCSLGHIWKFYPLFNQPGRQGLNRPVPSLGGQFNASHHASMNCMRFQVRTDGAVQLAGARFPGRSGNPRTKPRPSTAHNLRRAARRGRRETWKRQRSAANPALDLRKYGLDQRYVFGWFNVEK